MEEDLPSVFDIAKVGDIELQEFMENAMKSTYDLIKQLDDPQGDTFEHPLHKFLGLDKELRSIRGSLKVVTVKKVQLEECIEREKCKLAEIRDNPEYNDGIREDIKNSIKRLKVDCEDHF